jgi:hypothetical protein
MVADDKTTPGLSSCEFSKKVNEEREREREAKTKDMLSFKYPSLV